MPKKILLADDSITIQKVISITLGGEDCDLTIVGDGESAVKKAMELKPDIVLADISMPGKNGYEVCEAIKKDPSLSHISVMLLAGTFEPLNKDEAARVGADGSIVKPFESQELIAKVNNLIDATMARVRQAKESRPAPGAGPLIQAPPEVQPFKPEAAVSSEDIWEAGDFLGFPEEDAGVKETKEAGGAPDLAFLEGGFLEEPEKEAPLPEAPEKTFVDLEFGDEFLTKDEPVESKGIAPIEFNAGDFSLEHFESKEAGHFEPEPFHVPPVELTPEPFEIEEKKVLDSRTEVSGGAWGDIKDEAFEPGFIEAPSEPVMEEGPALGKAFETRVEPFKPVEPAAPLSGKVQEPSQQQAGPAFQMPEVQLSQFSGLIDKAVESAAKSIKEDLVSRINAGGFIPRDELKAIVEGISRAVVEEVAWEVIPELAEEMIRAEIAKIKEAISRLK